MISPLRRATINVPTGKMDEARAFYETVLGMNVFFQNLFESKEGIGGGEAELLGLQGDVRNRIVVLQQGDSTVGMVGLHEFLHPDMEIQPLVKSAGLPYPLIFVFAVEGIAGIQARAEAFGCEILMPVHEWEIPGKGMAKGLLFLDPIGVVMDLTEMPGSSAGSTIKISPVRRVTVPVPTGKMSQCRRFYEEAFEMKPYYDSIIEGKGERSGLGVGDYSVHLVSEQQAGTTEGMVGLIDYLEPKIDVRPYARSAKGAYPVAFVFLVDDMATVFARAAKLSPLVICPPLAYEVPGRGLMKGATLLDPAGVLVNLAELPS